jgi:cytochrome P450
MDRIWTTQNLTLSKSMLTGLTQTLPSFLAKAWLALLQNPDQSSRLLAEPDLMPGAVEELLRYAGIVHSLYRRATSEVRIGDTQIAANDHVTLRLGSANFDPDQFHEPRRLDIARRRLGHVGLGTGPHNCVGAVLVRVATAVTTPIFLASAPVLDTSTPILWTGDNTLRWPSVVSARMGSKEPANT